MIIAIDFDGTCVTHAFPAIGEDIGAVPVLKALVNCGHQLILHTMRDATYLSEAEAWFAKNEIPLYASNDNPSQVKWSKSRKVYAHLYIDDAALGVPLKLDLKISRRPFVDWEKTKQLLERKGLIYEI